jgi:hypothetical protein
VAGDEWLSLLPKDLSRQFRLHNGVVKLPVMKQLFGYLTRRQVALGYNIAVGPWASRVRGLPGKALDRHQWQGASPASAREIHPKLVSAYCVSPSAGRVKEPDRLLALLQ